MADIARKFSHSLSGLGFLNLESMDSSVNHKLLKLFIDSCAYTNVRSSGERAQGFHLSHNSTLIPK